MQHYRMATSDSLTDEEHSIVLFLERYFEQHGMRGVLAMLRSVDTKPADLRLVIDGYRDLWQRQQN
jgi:hypothetical protein